jgi:hypothetical protein
LPEQDANALAYRGKVFDRIRGKKVLFDLAFRGSKDRHTLEKKNDTNLLEMVMNHDSFVLYKYFFFIFPAKTRQFYFAKGHLHGRSLPRKRTHLASFAYCLFAPHFGGNQFCTFRLFFSDL